MILVTGEVLFDVFPDYRRMGGAPFNFCYHLHAFGYPAVLVSRIGHDDDARTITALFQKKGLSEQGIQVDRDHPTGYVNIALNEMGNATFDIVESVAYDYLTYTPEVRELILKKPKMIYFGTLIQRTKAGAATVDTILRARDAETVCFYDINLRPKCYTPEIIRRSLNHCDILKINKEELEQLTTLLNAPRKHGEIVNFLRDAFNIDWICITKGKHGSELLTPHGHASARPCGPEERQVVDTVGAGDAFSAVLAAGYLEDWAPEKILERATEFAGAVCRLKGAIPDGDEFYESYGSWFSPMS